MKIYLVYDYDDRCVEATCDGLKASQMVDELNGPGENFPYYYISLELHDVPQQTHAAAADNCPDCKVSGFTVFHKKDCEFYE